MDSRRVARMSKFLPFAALFAALFGLAVMLLWNWLAPAVFGLRAIGYWQALGLVVLCRILFGGRGSMGSDRIWRHRILERWDRMTPEERERFREGFADRWHRTAPPPTPSA